MFVSAIEVFLVPSKQGAPLRAEWLELLVERLYFILTKYRAAPTLPTSPYPLYPPYPVYPSYHSCPPHPPYLSLPPLTPLRFLNLMRRDLGAPGLPPKPERPKLDDLLAQARRGLETHARLGGDYVQRWMDPKASSELSKGAVRSVQSLCVRLHSLGYCTLQLGVLSQLVDARWAGVQARRTFYGREARPAPVTVLSNGAPEAVAATIDLMCEFIGAKVPPPPTSTSLPTTTTITTTTTTSPPHPTTPHPPPSPAQVVHEDLRQHLHDGLYVERLKDEERRGELWPRLSSHSPPLLVRAARPAARRQYSHVHVVEAVTPIP